MAELQKGDIRVEFDGKKRVRKVKVTNVAPDKKGQVQVEALLGAMKGKKYRVDPKALKVDRPKRKMAKKTDERMSAREAAKVVLINNGAPMHYREIARTALEQGIVKVRKGASEEATIKTMRSFLAGEVAGESTLFVRVDSGVFDLKNREPVKS